MYHSTLGLRVIVKKRRHIRSFAARFWGGLDLDTGALWDSPRGKAKLRYRGT